MLQKIFSYRLFTAFILLKLSFFSLIALPVLSIMGFAEKSVPADLAFAEDLEESLEANFPYEHTFIISAYYSPLPCQDRYATGSYAGDIRLNGRGVRGADGTAVYPGMIAAPKSYPFGTKMYVPGVGIVSVHDRGGAIVPANVRGNAFDRLDIWMGYGDKGLRRALNWGKRTVTVTVYGVTNAVIPDVALGDYDPAESVPKECLQPDANLKDTTPVETPPAKYDLEELAKKYEITLAENINNSLAPGSKGEAVKRLQEELQNLNFYKAQIHGNYDNLTTHAVFKFQQARGILTAKSDRGAGVVGPRTRETLNQLITLRNNSKVLIAHAGNRAGANQKLALKFDSELDFGENNEQVLALKKFLSSKGFLQETNLHQVFDLKTKNALIAFQLENDLINSSSDQGAGRVGPRTLKLLQSLAT